MKTVITLLLSVSFFVVGFQLRDYVVLEQAASKAMQDIRNAFHFGVVEGRDESGVAGAYWPRNARIPDGVQRNFPIAGRDIKITMEADPDQVLLYCRPVYGRELIVVLYDNGTVSKLVGSPPPFVED